jgi:hypothetical protein
MPQRLRSPQLKAQIGELHKSNSTLAAQNELLTDRFSRLIDNLAMNRAVDAKHLKIRGAERPHGGNGALPLR